MSENDRTALREDQVGFFRPLPEGYRPVVTMRNGNAKIHSEPVDEAAAAKNPRKMKVKFRVGKEYEGMTFHEILTRARISQIPVNIEMLDMKKIIGDMEEPYQDSFQEEWRKSKFQIVPEKLPPAIRCTMKIEGSGDDMIITLKYDGESGDMKFSYRFCASSWNSLLKFYLFMKNAGSGTRLILWAEDENEEILDAMDTEMASGEPVPVCIRAVPGEKGNTGRRIAEIPV